MPRGGARTGSGRKPKVATAAVQPFVPVVHQGGGDGVTANPPNDLAEDQREFWRRYAVRAINQGTLTNDTEPAFRLLCELDTERQATKAQIDKDGRTYIKCVVDGAGNEHQELKAHPLKGDYRQLSQRVEALLARFKLAPFGKPEQPNRKQKTPQASPWARVAGK